MVGLQGQTYEIWFSFLQNSGSQTTIFGLFPHFSAEVVMSSAFLLSSILFLSFFSVSKLIGLFIDPFVYLWVVFGRLLWSLEQLICASSLVLSPRSLQKSSSWVRYLNQFLQLFSPLFFLCTLSTSIFFSRLTTFMAFFVLINHISQSLAI